MCVGVVAWRAHPHWPLIVAANRDEFHHRPSAALAQWTDHGGIIAGRDLTAGGTWLGVATTGRLAFVTNYRGDGTVPPARLSRGSLVADWLLGDDLADPAAYNPFNLILIDGAQYATFITNMPAAHRRALAPGIHGLSNGAFDAPWPKTERVAAATRACLGQDTIDPGHLFAALRDESPPPEPVDFIADAGPAFPAVFVNTPDYGTRCSTVLAVNSDGAGWIEERRFIASGAEDGRTRITFDWPL